MASIPAEDGHWAYLSSGTWSLIKMECPEPIINDQSRALNFTNEVGYGHTIRLLKNISGMWLIQECRRTWQQDGFQYSYEDLSRMAEPEPAFQCLIDPTDDSFLSPVSMPDAMDNFCRRTGQPVPRSHGQYIRCALDSLALLYAKTLRELEELTGIHRTVLHIVGGGSRNRLLNQLAANATQIPVIAGPVEATALGNILIQYAQTSRIPLASARKSLLISFPTQKFLPQANSVEKSTYEKFLQISCE
ncbi:MAG: hypothetical protein LR011_12795 [Verrucomicrobia bacterium]|nr:hypothetical protein [Verrucomicrobiota bacterium]